MGVSRYDPRWVAPFGDPRIKAWLAAPRGLSQLPHVLRRLLMPRHPPDTLSSLGNIFILPWRFREILGQLHSLIRVNFSAVKTTLIVKEQLHPRTLSPLPRASYTAR